jgi:GGDEF domain-containing protein
MDRLQHAVIRMQRDQQKLAVCLVSVSYPLNPNMLPDLKKFVEQHLVSRLLGSVRKGDTVARLEDDRYALILEAIRDPRDLDTITQKIVNNVGTPILTQGQRVMIKLVLGGSVFPVDGMDPMALLDQAVTAMREARIKQASFYYPPSD